MANNFRAADNERAEPVVLAPVHSNYFNQISTEPQMVIRRASNNAYLYFSSNDSANLSIAPTRTYVRAEGDPTLMTRVKRMGLTYFRYTDSTPVIDDRNNNFKIWVETTNTVYNVDVEIGDWNTPQLLMRKLAAAFAISGIPTPDSITFRFSKRPNFDKYTVPKSDGEVVILFPYNVYFLPTSSAMLYGRSTYAFPVVNILKNRNGVQPEWNRVNPVNQQTDVVKVPASGITPPVFYTLTELYTLASYSFIKTGYMPCSNTRFIDIFAPTINNFTKLPNASTRSPNSSLLYRLYLDQFTGYDNPTPADGIVVNVGVPIPPQPVDTPVIYQKKKFEWDSNIANPITFCRNIDESINAIFIIIQDEYGRLVEGTPPQILKFLNPALPQENQIIGRQEPAEFNWDITWEGAFYCEI